MYGIVWKNITEFGRGGACVPARVALQGRIRCSSPAYNACIFGMETPLRGRSGGHAGAAPTVSFVWIACKWSFCLYGIVWKNITEFGRGGACVPARVALQGRIRRSFLAHDACIFGMETPLRGRSGGHAGTAPTVSFGWVMMWAKESTTHVVGSPLSASVTQGRLSCTCQPCAIESKTALR